MLHTLTHINPEILAEIAEEKKVRHTKEFFLLFPLGSQFDHLILQRIEKLGVYILVADSGNITSADVEKLAPKGIILSGGPASVYEEKVNFDATILDLGIPVLGICLGFQLWADHIGAEVTGAPRREFGVHEFKIAGESPLFSGIEESFAVLESHGDIVTARPDMEILGSTQNTPVAAASHKHLVGVQFHPEVSDTEFGDTIFENFIFKICGAKDRFPAERVAEKKVKELAREIDGKKVLLALSGGSDSSVVAYLLKNASRNANTEIHAVYIKGIDRPDDEAYVKKFFANEPWLSLTVADATDDFVTALSGKITMKEKRLAMRGVYKNILEDEAKKIGAGFIAQGTLYTDVSESGGGYQAGTRKAQIKIHHNVNLGFSVPELAPLIDCVKDNARNIGREAGVPEELLLRHPFPGPGLIVRIEGEVTKEKLSIAHEADRIYIEELRAEGLYESIWQAGAVITQSITTCTKGDEAVSGYVVALWAVWSVNGFTATAAELPYDFLKKVSKRLTNEIREVGAVVYRLSDKPPATIEWG